MPEGRFLVRPLEDRFVRRTAGVVVLTLVAGLLAVTGVTPHAPAQAAVSVTQVGAWSFDAGTGTTAADSAGSHPLTLGSGATWSPGIRGASALAVNGSTTGNATSSGAVLNTASSFSVSAYVKLNNLNGFQTFVSQDGTTNSGFYLQLQDSDRFSFNMEAQDATGSSAVSAISNANAVVGYWYHLVGVYNSVAGTTALYVNGRLQSTMTKPAAFGTTGSLAVGRGKYNGSPVDFVNGAVDDVRAYSGALTAADVEQIADAAYYKLDEGTGTTATDAGLNGFNAVLTNGPSWIPGVIGPSAVDFDGTNDFIDANNSVLDTSKSFSVSAWTRTTQLTTPRVVASVDGTNYSGFTLSLRGDGKWAFARASSDVSSPTLTSAVATATAATGTWYHLVGVYDSVANTLALYVDGVKQGASVSYTTGWKATGDFAIGRSRAAAAPAGYYTGAIDEVHAYPFVVDDAMASALAAPPAPPAPATPAATTSGTSATVTWVAPAPISGSPTTGYVVTPYVNGTAQSPQTFNTTATSQTFAGLTAGSSYRYTVAAINANGTSAPSGQSVAVVPNTVPGTPTAPTATAGTQSATVTWTAPSNSGTAITGYVVTPYIGATAQTAQTFSSTATTQTATGLTAGTAYTFKVAAQNAAGTGTASAASNAVTPNAAPSVSSGAPPNGRVGLSYSFQYTVSAGTSPATWSVSSGTLPAGLTLSSAGLLSGTPTTSGSSTFTVRVTDASSSTASQPATVVVSDRPGTVSTPTAAAGVTSATVSWSAPASNGSAITGYVVTPYLSGVAQTPVSFDASATARNVTGLTANGSYTFTVAAVNAVGTGAASPQSTAVTVYDVPLAPTGAAATAGTQRATVTWTAGSANGSAITGYVVTPYIGATAQTATTFASTATTQTVTGLTAGTAYTFRVAAQNAAGTGPQSAASPAVTPNANPVVTSTSPPGGAAGSAYSYQLTSSGGTAPFAWSVASGTLPAGIALSAGGLLSGTPTTVGSSTFTVQVSDGSSQTATSSLTVVVSSSVPAAPARPTAAAGVTSATVSWSAPASNGSAITGYVVTPYLSGVAQTSVSFDASATARNITGLTGGGSYTFTVAAVNANGTGPASPQSNAVTVTDVPAAPTITAATAGDLRVTVTWAAGSANGSAITGYVVTPYLGGTAQTASTFASTATTQTVTGLTAGTAYTFRVAAQNAVGTGPQSAASAAVTPNANPTVATTTPPPGVVGAAYSYQLAAAGGTAPFSWSVASGTLPAGLTLSAGGLLSGTPTTVGSSTFTVQVSDANAQTATQSLTVTVTAKPATPAAPTATAGLTSAVLTWTAPASNGATITGYVITPYISGVAQPTITVDPSGKTRTLNGLTAGSIYTFTVAAVNANGTGTASAVSNPVTPYAALNAPAITSVTAGTTSATLTWTAPTSTANSAITGYVVTPYIGGTAQTPQSFPGSATTRTVTGLTPGTAYTFTVAAQNNSGTTPLYRIDAGGSGAAALDSGPAWADDSGPNNPLRTSGSNASNFGAPNGVDSTVPATTPVGIFNTERWDPGNSMSWAFPVAAGAPVTVRLFFVEAYWTGAGQRRFDVALDGTTVLPNFDVYTAAGASRIGTMREFSVTSDGTVNIDFGRIQDNAIIDGIEILQTGTATTGPASSASAAVTPNATPVVTSTSPPAGVVATAYSYQLTNSGGTSPFTWSLSSGTLPAGITLSTGGLLSGTPTTVGSSTFTVQVSDASGQTATQSLTVVVSDKPGTIAKPTAVAGPTSATVSWTAPTSNGSAITGYVVTPYLSGVAQAPVSFDASATTRTVTGLSVGGSYKFSVAAVNANGTGAMSLQSDAVTIYDVPSAPTITAATAGDLRATLTWTAAGANGNAVTGYVVTPYVGGIAQTPVTFFSTALTQTITGLTAGTAYTFRVAGQNAGGAGAQSAASPAVTPNANPTVTSTSPPAGVVGTAYSYQLTNGGGTAPFTWSVITGSLPAGITLTSAGLLSGTPTTAGSSAFTVQVSDGNSQTATSSLTIVVSSTTPSAPATPTAAAGVTSATVSWTAPASNGSAITGYVVTPYLSGVAQTSVSFDASATTRNITGLTGGGSYTFTVAAVNANGTGPASPQSNAVTVTDVPAAPTITAATAGDLRVTVTWAAGSANGSAITGYVVTPYLGGTAQTATTFASTATTQTVTGLTAGTAYTFRVAAQNAVGTGPQSAASAAVTPNANPTVTSTDPPAGVVGAAYSYQLTVGGGTSPFSWSRPTGTLPAGLTLSAGGLLSGTPTTVGSSTFTVQVSDANGQTATASLTVPVSDRPGTVAKPTAAAGVTSATVSWTAPASNGSAITGYVVTPYLSGVAQTPVSFDASVTARNVTGLVGGGSYTFTVAAVNANGTGPASPQSTAVTVTDVPAAPSITAATAGTAQATLTWTAPASNGSTITGYVVTPYLGSTAQTPVTFSTAATTQIVTGLTPGAGYTFRVAAQNAAGTGPQSAASSVVTPNANPTVTSTTPPAGAVGSAYSYQLTVAGGTAPFTWSLSTGTLPAGLTLNAAGLISGTPTTVGSSTVTVRVTDASGQTATQSLTIAVSSRPGTPAAPTATAGLTSAVLTWTAPASNGATITGYVITPYLSGVAQSTITVDPSAKTRTLNGLTAGSSYTFTVAAVNANGTSAASAASNTVTPYAALNAPTIGSVTAGTTSATLSWTAPSSTGNSPITGYVITPYIGSTAQPPQTFTGTATTRTVTGLTPGTAYTFKVAATNNSGSTVLNRLSADPVAAVDGGPDWADNATYRGGSSNVYDSGVPIGAFDATVPSTTPSALFSAERWGNDAGNKLTYAIPVASGTPVKVRLYFANTYPGTATVGAREFDVSLDAVTVLPSFDPVAAAGGTSIATMREFAITSDGTVNLDFTPRRDTPAIYGIELVQTGTATTGPDSAASTAVTPNDSPTLTFPAPPSGEVGVAYSQQLVVNGGSAPVTWSVSSGSLPPGITLGAASGVLGGTPTAAGSYAFTVQVTDASGATATRNVTLAVAAQPSVAFSPAAGEVGVAYSQQPTLTGGTGPSTWSISAGSLPAGLSITTASGLVSGTPTASGTFSVTLRVVDAFNQVATRTASIVIAPLPTLTSTPPKQYQQAGFGFTFAATGGTGPFTYAVVSGSLPPGISLSAAGGLTGQTNQGTYPFTVRATDANGQTADDPVTLVVDAPPVQLVKTASANSVAPGGTVTFTLTATNISTTFYGNTHAYDPLGDVLDDATYNGDVTASAGSISYSGSTLDWAIPLNGGQSATLTYTVTVANPDTGNKILTGQVDGIFSSTSCSSGQRTSACTAAVTVSGLSVSTTANVSTTTPGSTVSYSVVVTNTGQTPYANASVSQNLGGLLDDATYRGDAAASAGSVNFTNPTLVWTGPLAAGASATITYSVRVNDPDTGNRSLTVTALSSAAGSTCPSGNPAASCSSSVTVLVPALSVSVAADSTTTTPGDPVTFLMTLTNTGQTAYTGTSAALALAGTLDDATYVSGTADRGDVGYDSGTLTWTGDLAVGATVVVTVVVGVADPDTGNRSLVAVASSAAAGSTCPAGAMNAACSAMVQVLLPGLTIATSADVATTTPGSVVQYTVAVTNSGQTAVAGASVSVPLSGVLDDATYAGDVATTAGTAGYASSTVSWTGDLAVGATATITYSVTVRDPDPGNLSLTSTAVSSSRGSTCPSGGSDARCSTTVTVLIPGLTITDSVNSGPTTTPGASLRYTVTVVNSGQTAYTNALIVLDSRGLGDDATFNNDGTESAGTVTPQPDGTFQWVLSLSPGQTATGSGSYRVNDPPTGDRVMTDGVSSSVPGSSCPTSASPSCSSTVTVLVPALTLSTTADAASVTPGDTIRYTAVATNTGETAYAPAVITDDLSAVLTDATYDNDASATTGAAPALSGSTLTWSGPLAVGESLTITFTVTVRDPDPGSKFVLNRVVSGAAGSTCPAGSSDSRCTAGVVVAVPGLTFVAAAGVATTTPGASVTSTVTVTNSGATAYTSASFALSLAGILDDAAVTGPITATVGTATNTGSAITWTGPLTAGASATITYTVTVHTADGGDNRLIGTVVSTSRNASCVAGGTDPRCTTNVPVARLALTQTAAETTATPGSTVHISTTWTNTGQVPYTGITIVSPRADTSDDTNASGDQTTSSGTLVRTATALTWTGDIGVGVSVTGTRTLLVKNPDPGNKIITATLFSDAPGNNCPDQTTDSRCTFVVTVLVPELTITKTASTTATLPGGTVGYTITVHNTGQTSYTGASWTDSLAGVLDDASYAGGAVADVGEVSYAAPSLSWSGNLAVGQTATITYSLTATSPSTGDKTMVNVVSSDTPGSTCPTGSSAAACRSTVIVLTQRLAIVKTSSATNSTLGSTVDFTITVTNAGQTSYTGAAFSNSLSGVLDDAVYNGDAAVTGPGSVGYSSGVLSWSGNLSPGVTATVTYSVTIDDPSTGDLMLTGAVVSGTVGNNCAASSTDPRCSADVAVTNAVALTLTTTADVLVTVSGALVHYSVTAVNSSGSEIAGADFSDSLSGVLDDADVEGDVTASSGTVTRTGSDISWAGDVPAGGTVTVRYAVRVRTPAPGDMILTGGLTSTSPAESNNCLAGSTDPRCASRVPVASLVLTRYYGDSPLSPQASTTPGSTIRLNAAFTNTGQYDYRGISISSLTANSNDDAVPVGDQTATSGTLVLTSTTLTWTGDIPVGATVTVTGTLLVKNPDTGNRTITGTLTSSAPGNNCPPGGSDPRCTSSLSVLLPELTITKSANTAQVDPGDQVDYTITVTDSGETPYAGATVTDDLGDVLDDAVLVGAPATSSGAVGVADGVLTWTGGLAVGGVVTISYSVQVERQDPGDRYLSNSATSTDPGSTCQPFDEDPGCSSLVRVLSPALLYTVQTDRETSRPGQVVTSTILIANGGETTYAAARVSVPLADVLDDATLDGSPTASGSDEDGSVVVVNGLLSWTGRLAPGDTVLVSYSVTVDNPVTGNFRLDQTATSDDLGSFCSSGTDNGCSTSVPIASLHLSEASDVSTIAPRGVVRFTERYVNVGQVPLYGVHIIIDVRDTDDDATFNGDATPSSGSITLDPATLLLTWVGDIGVGETVTTTGSGTVNYPTTGNKHLRNRLSTDEPSNCPLGSTDPACVSDVRVLNTGLSIVTTPGASTTTPGSQVGYTTTVTNNGEIAYTGATVTDDLSGILDDTAAPTAVGATTGQATVNGSTLTWTGNIPVSGSVVISYSVRVRDPDPGNLNLVNHVTSDALGSTCPSGSTGSACTSLVTVLIPALDVGVTADTATAYPGAVVTYTLTVTNSGQTDYASASATVALAGVLDDATYGDDAAPSRGSVDYTAPNLTWTGGLAVGESAVTTYTVTVDEPDPGDRTLLTAVSSTAAGSSCPVDAPCVSTVVVQIPALSVSTTADATEVTPGQQVTFTITVHNTGQRAYIGTVTTASLAGVLDDASLRGGFRASSGSVHYQAPDLTWTGTLLVADTATVRYTVLVDDPDAGDHTLATSVRNQSSGSTCRTGTTSSLCATSVAVLEPALGVAVTADDRTTTPGSAAFFTLVIENTGQTPYDGAVVTTSLASVLDDADYGADAEVTSGAGEVGYAGGVLTWNGDLPVGASATVRFSVQVRDPDLGDKELAVTTASTVQGSTCLAGSGAAGCSATVEVLVPGLAVSVAADATSVVAGSSVHYTVTVENTGETDYAQAAFTADLADVLDDGSIDQATLTASTGTVVATAGGLSWSGPLLPGDTATIGYDVVTAFPATGDRSLLTTLSTTGSGSSCTTTDAAPECANTVQVLVPALSVSKSASRTSVVAGETLSYTLTATNAGESPYAAATLDDDLTGVLAHATYSGGATASTGTVAVTAGHLTWAGPLAIGESVVVTYSVTVGDPGVQSGVVLTNAVTSTTVGSTCPVGGNAAACTTATGVDADTLTLTGLTSSFTLTGLPGDTVSLDDAVVGTVVTNSATGYRVTVQAAEAALVGGPGNPDTIPVSRLLVRANGTSTWVPLSATAPVTVGGRDRASAPGGDAISSDARIQIPDVSSDTYAGELDYIVATQ